MCRGPVPHTPRFGWGEIIPDIYLILCFTHFSQSPRGSRSDPGRIQWISANMASPAGSSETQKQKRSAVARARGNFSGGNKRERPRARRERCPSGAGEAPAALFTLCKVKPSSLKTKNGFFWGGIELAQPPHGSPVELQLPAPLLPR